MIQKLIDNLRKDNLNSIADYFQELLDVCTPEHVETLEQLIVNTVQNHCIQLARKMRNQ